MRSGLRALIALVAAMGLLLTAACGGDDGTTLPSGALARIDGGEPIDLSEGAGRPAVVNLWATWCVPCRQELPAFDAVAAAAGDDLDVYGVDVGDAAADARELVEELDLAFPQLLDPESRIAAGLEVVQMPTTAFVAADGEVVEVHAGAFDVEGLVAAIDEHLGVRVDVP